MTAEHDTQAEQHFYESLKTRVLSRFSPNGIPDGSEVSVQYRGEKFTMSLAQMTIDEGKHSGLTLAAYKKRPQFGKDMLYEPIGHVEIKFVEGTVRLSTSPFGDDKPPAIDTFAPQVQASVIAFTSPEDNKKHNALDVETNYRGRGYGILLYALGKALARERGYSEMRIVGPRLESVGFYEKLGVQSLEDMDFVKITPLTFSPAEQEVLNALRIIGPTR